MDFFPDARGSTSKKKDKKNFDDGSTSKNDTMNTDDLEDSQHGKQEDEKFGHKKNDDVEDPRVGDDFGKVDCTTGIINWSFTLGPWEAIVLKLIIMFFLVGCLAFLVMKLIKEGRVLTGKDLVGKKA